MRYRSTRGRCSGLTFEDAVMTGFASDGGILMPEHIPNVSQDTLRSWARLSYPELVKQIVPMFVDEQEIPKQDLDVLLDRAFSLFSFPEVVRIASLKGDLKILELFHGPTLAFKDIALSCLAQFLEYFLTKRNKHITTVVCTSGDTGSAALESVRGLSQVDLVVLLPRGYCTRIQELQMTTVIADNCHVYRVDGTSDDADVVMKAIFRDVDFTKKHHLGSLNSINWGRILVQIAHYFYACLQLCPEADHAVEVVIPTGACGNVTAGCIANQMGLPVKLTCAVNVNDIVARTIAEGDFSVSQAVIPTLAPAMDIQVPYNMERLLYLFSQYDVGLVRSLLEEIETNNSITVPENVHEQMRSVISSHVARDKDIQAAMQQCWQENQYLLCPHTAVAAHYHYSTRRADDCKDRICIATASPAKFEEAVISAGLTPQPTQQILQLPNKPVRYQDMEKGEDWEGIVRAKIEEITARVEK